MVTRTAMITKEYTFEAAHQLPHHDGQCARLHGHSYKLQVSVSGPVKPPNGNPDEGMVIDFKDLDRVVKPVVESLDHRFLNDVIVDCPPTAENIAYEIKRQIDNAMFDLDYEMAIIQSVEIKLWETAKAFVTVKG